MEADGGKVSGLEGSNSGINVYFPPARKYPWKVGL